MSFPHILQSLSELYDRMMEEELVPENYPRSAAEPEETVDKTLKLIQNEQNQLTLKTDSLLSQHKNQIIYFKQGRVKNKALGIILKS